VHPLDLETVAVVAEHQANRELLPPGVLLVAAGPCTENRWNQTS